MASDNKPAMLERFLTLREENIMNIKVAKENGRKVVGMYCTYCPRELVLAAGAIPVGLCGTREEPIAAAEKDLPRNLCPLIKSSYGFAVTDTCPYFHFSDVVIGETTCDGKKKMFELLSRIKPVHVINLPQMPDQEASIELLHQELLRTKAMLEDHLGVLITPESIRQAIHITNEETRALKALFDLNRSKPALLTGMDLLAASWQVGFSADRLQAIAMLDELVAEMQALGQQGYHAGTGREPRILLTGTPVGQGSEKVIDLVEQCGGLVVTMENCGGYKTLDLSIDENDGRDPLLLLAEKYIRIPCSVMTPNSRRLDLLRRMIDEFAIDGVIDLTWQACHTYNIESFWVADLVKNKTSLPFLQLETDYSSADRETLRVRIEAFMEMF